MSRRMRIRITVVATLLAIVAPSAAASADQLCTRVWVASTHQKVCVPVP